MFKKQKTRLFCLKKAGFPFETGKTAFGDREVLPVVRGMIRYMTRIPSRPEWVPEKAVLPAGKVAFSGKTM
jgi:hypothetical protein